MNVYSFHGLGNLMNQSYVQLVGEGVASIDMGLQMRYFHFTREVCDLDAFVSLAELLDAELSSIVQNFSFTRDGCA